MVTSSGTARKPGSAHNDVLSHVSGSSASVVKWSIAAEQPSDIAPRIFLTSASWELHSKSLPIKMLQN